MQNTPDNKVKGKLSVMDGAIIIGYVNNGAFLNFSGPNVSFSAKRHKVIIGMLPSLRFKKDNSTIRNSFVTPTLGVGITYCYKKLALQFPVYYNAKTSNSNGKWNAGFGIGIKFK
ncbi:MAG: hypothetical protein U0T56_12365 [Ferruginibacter sp.]